MVQKSCHNVAQIGFLLRVYSVKIKLSAGLHFLLDTLGRSWLPHLLNMLPEFIPFSHFPRTSLNFQASSGGPSPSDTSNLSLLPHLYVFKGSRDYIEPWMIQDNLRILDPP